jgi:hypothetical protein
MGSKYVINLTLNKNKTWHLHGGVKRRELLNGD